MCSGGGFVLSRGGFVWVRFSGRNRVFDGARAEIWVRLVNFLLVAVGVSPRAGEPVDVHGARKRARGPSVGHRLRRQVDNVAPDRGSRRRMANGDRGRPPGHPLPVGNRCHTYSVGFSDRGAGVVPTRARGSVAGSEPRAPGRRPVPPLARRALIPQGPCRTGEGRYNPGLRRLGGRWAWVVKED